MECAVWIIEASPGCCTVAIACSEASMRATCLQVSLPGRLFGDGAFDEFARARVRTASISAAAGKGCASAAGSLT